MGAVQDLKDEVAQGRQEIADLRARIASLESLQEQDVTRLACDIATDRRRLAALENPHKEPGKTETSRAEKIEKYLSSRPDHRATFETLKGHLGIDNDLLGIAVRCLLPSGKYAIIKTPGDKRKRTLVMLPR
jgi:chromosome segregation ATPase